MGARLNSRTRTSVALVAGGVLALSGLTGCSSGPLDTKCSDFMNMSADEQTDIAIEWNKDSVGGDMAKVAASSTVSGFQTYCADPDHADDKISELEYTF